MTSFVRTSSSYPINPLGLQVLSAGLNFSAQYWDDADEKVIESATQKFIDSVDVYTRSVGQYKRFRYMNYAYPTQDVIGSYGVENVEFLRKVSRKYDPAQVFQNLVPGGFKLGRAS